MRAQTDASYRRGRLMITPQGTGRFTFAVMRAPNKWVIRQRIAADAGPTNDHGGEATPAPIARQRTATATSAPVPGDAPSRGDHLWRPEP